MKLILTKNQISAVFSESSVLDLKHFINQKTGLLSEDYYLIYNGKLVSDEAVLENGQAHIVLRCCGGKGGFGSMLRAIGAQIEKTTNREACRDLSGRRLRDINEEKRLKNWINQQAEREKEAKDRRQKKLERLCEQPKHEFKDEQYDRERSDLPEVVESAVLKGLQASSSSKRKLPDKKDAIKKKKPKLWVDDELDDDLSSDNEEEEKKEELAKKRPRSPADSEESQGSRSSETSVEPQSSVHSSSNSLDSQSTVQSSNASLSQNIPVNQPDKTPPRQDDPSENQEVQKSS